MTVLQFHPRPMTEPGQYDHDCPLCGLKVRWAALYCYDCNENRHKKNPAWAGWAEMQKDARRSHGH